MKKLAAAFIFAVVFVFVLGVAGKKPTLNLYDINRGREISLAEAMPALKLNRIILIGEHHNNEEHHAAQLAVIRALKESGAKMAVGLEMFRSDSQPALDRWVEGTLDESKFQKISLLKLLKIQLLI